MVVLVTGHRGYIGSVLVPRLLGEGHVVIGVDTGWFSGEPVGHDIRDFDMDENPDVVVHLAGLSNDPMGDLRPSLTWDINYWGTIGFVSRFPHARHVVVSSCAVYGQSPVLCHEENEPNPQTVYARCKAEVDRWLAFQKYDSVSLRLGTVFGHSPNHRLDLVVNRMVYDGLTDRVVRATGDAARPLTHVEDVASAILWAMDNGHGVYNVVGENMRMHHLGEIVGASTGAEVRASKSADTRDYMASGEKLLRAGWGPTRSVEGALPALIEASRQYNPFNLHRHIRLERLQALVGEGRLDPRNLRSLVA